MKWTVIPGILLPVLVVYAGYLIWLTRNQNAILFPGTQTVIPELPELRPHVKSVWLKPASGLCEMWLIPPREAAGPAPCVIFAHGNGEVLDGCVDSVMPFREMGFWIALVEYPGYGRSRGKPTERTVVDAFCAAYDTLIRNPGIDSGRILGYGRSMGAAAVCGLSIHRKLAGMILQSAFISVSELAKRRGVPGFLVREHFDNQSAVGIFQGPVLLFHGTEDTMIPFSHGETLRASAKNARLVPLECGHNDCPPDRREFWEIMTTFMDENGWSDR